MNHMHRVPLSCIHVQTVRREDRIKARIDIVGYNLETELNIPVRVVLTSKQLQKLLLDLHAIHQHMEDNEHG